jgi:hypothetical protein
MKPDFKDLCFLLGAALLIAGVAVVYWPVALMLAGLALVFAGVR